MEGSYVPSVKACGNHEPVFDMVRILSSGIAFVTCSTTLPTFLGEQVGMGSSTPVGEERLGSLTRVGR